MAFRLLPHLPLRRYITPHRYIFFSGSSCTYMIWAGIKMAWSPGEYGTATSISIFSKYFLVLLKRRPPRDMSSHGTTSSGKPRRRTQALMLTRVRACFRRFSGLAATPAPEDAGAGASAVTTSAAEARAVTGSRGGGRPARFLGV